MSNQIRECLFSWGVDTHAFEFCHMLLIYGLIRKQIICVRCTCGDGKMCVTVTFQSNYKSHDGFYHMYQVRTYKIDVNKRTLWHLCHSTLIAFCIFNDYMRKPF